MIALYFSGTGNTRYCLTKLVRCLDPSAPIVPLEDLAAAALLKKEKTVFLGYPTQFSNIPYFVRDFILRNGGLWAGKSVFLLNTMGAFSGDGTGVAARLLRKRGAKILGGLFLKMPDSIADVKALKKSHERNEAIVRAAEKAVEAASLSIKEGRYPQQGLGFWAHMAGLFGQRLWFFDRTRGYSNKLKVSSACEGCGLCLEGCPTHNLSLVAGKAVPSGRCAMCYRCVVHCPKKAITILGKEVIDPIKIEDFLPKE
jgi:ferredoxin